MPAQEKEFDAHLNIGPIIGIVTLFVLVIILRRAWMGDDAFISLRVIDNFVNGYGLTFNISERVQVFTHPLWLFMISIAYYFTREPYFTTLILNFLTSVLAVVLFTRISPSRFKATTSLVILGFSNAFVDYSTSGLENALTHLLLIVFCIILFRADPSGRQLFWLSLVASLAGVNRLDSLIFFLFPLIACWWKSERKRDGLIYILLGQLPLLAWVLFSLVYYGFPFPNTYYSKLGAGLPKIDLVTQGFVYYLDSITRDPITLSAIFGTLVGLLILRRKKQLHLIPLAFGLVMYLGYILYIGGDFMAGRFFSAPLVLALIVFCRLEVSDPAVELWPVYMGAVALLGLLAPVSTLEIASTDLPYANQYSGVFDERAYYFEGTGLVNQARTLDSPHFEWRTSGENQRLLAQNSRGNVVVSEAIGMLGYYAGPNVHIIDPIGLADPLLARLPAVYEPRWRIGHFGRYSSVPGYQESIETASNQIRDSKLRIYYDYLVQVTRGPIWSLDRFRAIYHLNLGHFDYLIDSFGYRYPRIVITEYEDYASLPDANTFTSCESEGKLFGKHGLLILRLEDLSKMPLLRLGLTGNVAYELHFYLDKEDVGKMVLPLTNLSDELLFREVPIRDDLMGNYNQLHILPTLNNNPDNTFCLSYFVLVPD